MNLAPGRPVGTKENWLQNNKQEHQRELHSSSLRPGLCTQGCFSGGLSKPDPSDPGPSGCLDHPGKSLLVLAFQSCSRKRETASPSPPQGTEAVPGASSLLRASVLKASPGQEAGLGKLSWQRGTEKVLLGSLRRITDVVESYRSDLLAGQTELQRAGRGCGFWPADSRQRLS